ncbi:SpaA isopeptide-forming pilin-related protein [Listeria innocua]|uniref:SpaA isopeptide-forming pilin-related protein n=1 Tax=Listeria innocua TaxID=1642 RepID=UPI00162A3233|nr:SpaA isopeptide-forming pilin-related protein [Listeria innocua]MBC2238591.1 collagen binding domain-containing protein [Listeria innocua]
MSKNGNLLKRVGLAFLSVLIIASTIFQTTIVKAATSYGSEFLNTVELLDNDGMPQTDFGYYDNMDVHYTWSIPNSTNVKAGDSMDFTLPSQLALATDLAFDVKDSKGQTVGTATVKRATNQVTVVFSDYVEKHSDIKGELDFWTTFNQKVITGKEKINLESPIENSTINVDVNVGEKTPVSPTETIFKYGWVDANNPSLIHWVVRVNYAQKNIPNAVFTDIIGAKQTLNFDSIKAFHGTYSTDRVFTAGTPISNTNFSKTSDGFRVTLGNLTDSVQISYTTTATDGGKSTQYDNTAKLAGEDFVTKQTSTWTPASGGGGGADGTTGSVTLTKQDAKTKATLEGAEFKLVDANGTILQENITTDASGQLNVSNLKFATYQLIETKAPTGYKLDSTPVEFTIGENNKEITVTKENTLNTGAVELTKVDAATKALLAGATFELQDKDGSVLQTDLKTDGNGILNVTDLVPGNYQFVETSAPTGYKLDSSPVPFEIIADETDQIVKVTKENILEVGAVELTKVDATTKALLAGATFELQDKDGKTLQTGLTTDENGVLKVTDLVPGTYQFVETNAPIGYELDASPVVFEILYGENDQVVKVTKENKAETTPPPTPLMPTPPVPIEPKVPIVPEKPVQSEKSEESLKLYKISTAKKLPKTGDTHNLVELGMILLAFSISGFLIKRK